ncbi:hypothetical protein C8J56DRAFT_919382 [Mycena floridula]|nr:hypothetical protein C8J56DRAFT_919382 [Mycena floridula]
MSDAANLAHSVFPRTVVRLVLSDDASVEAVLTDIPLFCVGLLAFGVSTFFLVMKRINLLAIYLYTSTLLAFGAAVLDLTQLLSRGTSVSSASIDTNSLNGLINTREIGLALSIGFRFLFFWTFVAERPRGEPPPPNLDQRPFNPRYDSHSASWERWGYLGFALKWILLAASLSIPLLQIIWRLVQRRYDIIYMVSTTIEIVVSALFVIKVMLNIFLSPQVSSLPSFRAYSAPLLALLINVGISVGNLVLFTFSEMTLGRFLQAVEIYILILFLLISTFYKNPVALAHSGSRSRRSKGTSSFGGLREKARESAFQTNPSDSKEETFVVGRAFSSLEEASRPESAISRIGSWILPRRLSRRPSSRSREQLVVKDPEQGLVSQIPISTGSRHLSSRVEIAEEKKGFPEPVPDSPVPAIKVMSPSAGDQTSADRPTTNYSLSSYYGPSRRSASFAVPSFPREGSDSPVYGLYGIMAQNSNRTSKESRGRTSMSSFDELLRQQTELDKSIAALRLFSPESAAPFPESPKAPTPAKPGLLVSNRTQSSSSNSTAPRVESSARSEFSLSIFPEPPATSATEIVAEKVAVAGPRPQRVPPLRTALRTTDDFPSVPNSPSQPGMGSRLDSAGTQYEITSFIGHLTLPSGQRPQSSYAQELSDVESGDETPIQASNPSALALRPILLGSTLQPTTATSLGPATASSGVMSAPGNRSSVAMQQSALRPFILGTSGQAVPINRPGVVPIGPRTRARSGSATTGKSRPNISGPKPQGDEEDQLGAFERPRPPPLVFQTP